VQGLQGGENGSLLFLAEPFQDGRFLKWQDGFQPAASIKLLIYLTFCFDRGALDPYLIEVFAIFCGATSLF
jgi:hypothetical protein